VNAVDKDGRLCLSARDRVYFTSEGPGHLSADLGTPTGSRVIELSSGIGRIVFKPVPGRTATIEARTHAIKGAYLVLDSRDARDRK